MIASVFEGARKIVVQEVPVPEIESGDLLVKVHTATICGTDLRIYLGEKTKGVRIPSILGHEFAGEIVEVGRDVTEWRTGMRVTVAPVIACGQCHYCRHRLENLCLNRTALGYEFDGAFAQYIRIPESALRAGNVFQIPEGVSFEEAAIVEPISCCINGQENMGHIQPGDKLLIVGAGAIGLMHLMLARAVDDTTIFVSEPVANRRQLAAELGAHKVIDPLNTDLSERILGETAGLGVDKVIMAIGVPDIVNSLVGLIRKGGGINLFAGFPVGSTAEMDVNALHYGQIHVSGASASAPRHFQSALGLMAEKRIAAQRLITDKWPLSQFEAALQATQARQGLKMVILP